jgi:hypothetical protein
MDFYPITLGTGRVLPTKDKARPASKEQGTVFEIAFS